jgi:hypothetical protein
MPELGTGCVYTACQRGEDALKYLSSCDLENQAVRTVTGEGDMFPLWESFDTGVGS